MTSHNSTSTFQIFYDMFVPTQQWLDYNKYNMITLSDEISIIC